VPVSTSGTRSGTRSGGLRPNPFALESESAFRRLLRWRKLFPAAISFLFCVPFAAVFVWFMFFGPADGSSRSNPEYYGWTGNVGGGWKLRISHASDVSRNGRSVVVAQVKLSRTATTSGLVRGVLSRTTLRGSDHVVRRAVGCGGLDPSPIVPTERIRSGDRESGAICFSAPSGHLSDAFVMVSRPSARPVWFALQDEPADPGG